MEENSKYVIGLDFGTLSARAVVVDAANGRVLSTAAHEYAHGVISGTMPDGTHLKKGWALQDPADYLEALIDVVPSAVRQAGVNTSNIIGIGVDFTASTTLPVNAEGTPLCYLPEFRKNPHAYVKLWRHHGAQAQADRMTKVARERGESWLSSYGGIISCEWSLPKLLEVLEEAPDIYDAMDEWVEAGDWLVFLLSGINTRNSSGMGYKTLYSRQNGFPPQDYFEAINLRFGQTFERKCHSPVLSIGQRAGFLTQNMADKLGLPPGISVAAANVDGPVCAPAIGLTKPGKMLMIIGTSTGHHTLACGRIHEVPGICGVVEDGMIPGYFSYESGQNCVGDLFAWFCENAVPKAYTDEAEKRNISIHQYLTFMADKLQPGESGVIALDWWNGNRSILVDSNLSGMLLGITLSTRPEEIYRALIEATAFGTRIITENYRQHGIPIDSVIASGGISLKNPMAMQIYADVLNMPVLVYRMEQGPAVGSAMYAAVAAGCSAGGYNDIFSAVKAMVHDSGTCYQPNLAHTDVYEKLYSEYKRLHDYFGKGENNIMKTLRHISQRESKKYVREESV